MNLTKYQFFFFEKGYISTQILEGKKHMYKEKSETIQREIKRPGPSELIKEKKKSSVLEFWEHLGLIGELALPTEGVSVKQWYSFSLMKNGGIHIIVLVSIF